MRSEISREVRSETSGEVRSEIIGEVVSQDSHECRSESDRCGAMTRSANTICIVIKADHV